MNVKTELREKLKIKRKYFEGYRRQTADAAIFENFFNAYGGCNSFLVYNSVGTEADTKAIIGQLLKDGKKVYLPRVCGEQILAVPYGETHKGAFGIEEPEGEPYTGEIDITVVPLLAVNGQGVRIGYGKGYYDRYLADRHTKKVGLGYFFQFENFEGEEHDVPLDEFVCEKGIYYYANK